MPSSIDCIIYSTINVSPEKKNYFVETCTVRGIELMRHDEYPRWPDILYVTVHESSCNSGHFNVMSCYYVALYWWFAVQVSVKRKSWRDTAARTFTIHRAGNVMQIEMLSKFITPLCLVNIVTVVSCSTDFSQKLPIFSLKKSNPRECGADRNRLGVREAHSSSQAVGAFQPGAAAPRGSLTDLSSA